MFNRSAPETRLLPDTDEDRSFVSAVSEMHAFFSTTKTAEVTEIMLRKNFNTPVYGKCCFGKWGRRLEGRGRVVTMT